MSQSHPTNSHLLDEHATAELIGMSVHWLRRKRWSGGGIPFVKMGDGPKGAVRYAPEDAMAYVRCRVRRSTSDPGQQSAPCILRTGAIRRAEAVVTDAANDAEGGEQ